MLGSESLLLPTAPKRTLHRSLVAVSRDGLQGRQRSLASVVGEIQQNLSVLSHFKAGRMRMNKHAKQFIRRFKRYRKNTPEIRVSIQRLQRAVMKREDEIKSQKGGEMPAETMKQHNNSENTEWGTYLPLAPHSASSSPRGHSLTPSQKQA